MSVFYSVIIPAYNAEKYIEQCICSVLSQSSTDYEIIVIDDGSDDSTGDIIREMTVRHTGITAERISHSGAGAARNAGVRMAQGSYIIFLDADDYWTNPLLLEQLKEKLMRRRVDLVMFQMDKYTEDGRILKNTEKDRSRRIKSSTGLRMFTAFL